MVCQGVGLSAFRRLEAVTHADARSLAGLAGGYDAIWVLVLSPSDDSSCASPAEEGVRQLWLDWTEMSVRPLSRKARIVGSAPTTDARQQTSGLQVQALGDVPGLEAAVRRRQ